MTILYIEIRNICIDTPDPLAERYPDQSPYAHCAGNPVKNIDPTGMDWITANYDGEHFFFYDERIKNQDDVDKYYQKSSSISYLGTEAKVRTVKSASQEETGRYELYSDGTFTHNGILQETEYNRDGLLHIGNDRLTQIHETPKTNKTDKTKKNLYGFYYGPFNPKLEHNKSIDSYAVPPIDVTDYYAFLHDRDYDRVGAKGPKDALFNPLTIPADLQLINRGMKSNNSLYGPASSVGFSILVMWKMSYLNLLYNLTK